MLKFSVHKSKYAQYSPDLLGENFQQNILKDYNGQTYWLSANIYSFLKKNSGFPKWLNVAVGYGAEGMTGGYNNLSEYNGNPVPEFDRRRQFYLSLDIDLTRIQTRSKLVNLLLDGFGFIKFPFPALEFNNIDGVRFHGVYF